MCCLFCLLDIPRDLLCCVCAVVFVQVLLVCVVCVCFNVCV